MMFVDVFGPLADDGDLVPKRPLCVREMVDGPPDAVAGVWCAISRHVH